MFISTDMEKYSEIRRKNGDNCYILNYDPIEDFFIKINNQNLMDFNKLYEEIITKVPTYRMFNLIHVRLRKMTMSSSRHLPPTIKTLEIYHLIRDCDISEFIIPESVEQLYIRNGLKTKDKIVLPRNIIRLSLFGILVWGTSFNTVYYTTYNNEEYKFNEYNIKKSKAKLIFYRNIKIPTSVQYIEDELITDDNGNNNCNNNCNNNDTTVMGHQKHKIQDKLNILVQIINKYYNGQFYIPREYIDDIIDKIEYHDIDDIICKKNIIPI